MNKNIRTMLAFAGGWLLGRLACAILAHNSRLVRVDLNVAGSVPEWTEQDAQKVRDEIYRAHYGANNPTLN